MTRKQTVLVAGAVVVASTLSAFVAYRLGLHRAASRPGSAAPSAGNTQGECVDFREAGGHIGETRCVSGRVVRVFTSRAGNIFLDFCPDYRDCPFGSVIFTSDRSKFGDLTTLRGRQLELRGLIASYKGRAEIVVRDPEQIRVLP